MRRIIRSSCYEDESTAPPTSLSSDVDERESLVGFRLAHDNTDRVYRGGCWFYPAAQFARVAGRNWGGPASRVDDLGFRLVREGA